MSLTNQMLRQIPPDVAPEAICLLDEILGHKPVMNRQAVSAAVFEKLERQFRGNELDAELERLHLSKMSEMNVAIDAYNTLCRKFPDAKFFEERLRGEGEDVTDTALFVIDKIVQRDRITDRFDIMSAVCDAIQKKYGNSQKLEAHLRRMHLATTKDILYAIDIYFVMKELYPDTIFGRERVREAWQDAI